MRDDGGLSRHFGKDGVSIICFGPKASAYFERSAVIDQEGGLLIAGESIHSAGTGGKAVELMLAEFQASP